LLAFTIENERNSALTVREFRIEFARKNSPENNPSEIFDGFEIRENDQIIWEAREFGVGKMIEHESYEFCGSSWPTLQLVRGDGCDAAS